MFVMSCNSTRERPSRHICTRINEHLNMDKASHIFKHLQDSPRCRTLCSSECFVVIDQATTRAQLKIKEAVHIHWEKPSLNQQLFHVNLTALFNNMRTLTFKAQPTNVFFAAVNQVFGDSSQLPTTVERAVIKSLSTVQITKQCSAVVGS